MERDDELFKLLEQEIRKNGPVVLWTGAGEFPGRASNLRGFAFGRCGMKEALYRLAGLDAVGEEGK